MNESIEENPELKAAADARQNDDNSSRENMDRNNNNDMKRWLREIVSREKSRHHFSLPEALDGILRRYICSQIFDQQLNAFL